VDQDARDFTGRRVEGNLRLDASRGPVKAHALLELNLRAAREDAMARREFQDGRGEYIHVVDARVAGDAGGNTRGLFPEDHARAFDRIAANIHQGSAAERPDIANVVHVQFEVAEGAHGRAKLADAPGAHQLHDTEPLRMN